MGEGFHPMWTFDDKIVTSNLTTQDLSRLNFDDQSKILSMYLPAELPGYDLTSYQQIVPPLPELGITEAVNVLYNSDIEGFDINCNISCHIHEEFESVADLKTPNQKSSHEFTTRKRKARTLFTAEQISVMENYFQTLTMYPTLEEKQMLSRETGLEAEKIKNRRCRFKKNIANRGLDFPVPRASYSTYILDRKCQMLSSPKIQNNFADLKPIISTRNTGAKIDKSPMLALIEPFVICQPESLIATLNDQAPSDDETYRTSETSRDQNTPSVTHNHDVLTDDISTITLITECNQDIHNIEPDNSLCVSMETQFSPRSLPCIEIFRKIGVNRARKVCRSP
ncbi:uncharacterized protein [Ptychodera flava]|uniref:uncharacterized protein isoform X2 n=1 Tax=Ptychodera flava TaxID=63121 RepID=UPI00396A4C3D